MRPLIYLLVIFLLPLPLLAQPTLLPPAHPAYDFLDRMETLGLLDHPLLGSKPVPRERIAELLDEVLAKTSAYPALPQKGAWRLSRVDRLTLEALRWEFAREAQRSGRPSPPAPHPEGRSRLGRLHDWMEEKDWFTKDFYRNGLNLYSYESPEIDAYVDPRGSARVIRQKRPTDPIVITAVGIRVRSNLYDRLGIYFDFLDITERGRGPYTSRSQLYQDREGFVGGLDRSDAANYDLTEFDLAIGGKWWELHAAKLPLRWGPGRSGQLLLSDWATSFHQAQFDLNLGSRLRLTYVFGTLKTNPYHELNDTLYTNAGYDRTIEANKFIAAHRLEWDPQARLRLAFAEAVIFGERNPELAYLIPINLFYSAQHDLGDKDNMLLSFDAAWIPHLRWKLYGELLIDDITFGKLGSDFYGNKLGWLGGLSWVEPIGLANVDATLEMARLRSFVYSHQFPINVYTHWAAPLGYRYPPNSEVLCADVRYRPHRRVSLEASWTKLLHGANPDSLHNVGGDINQPHAHGSSENAPFLAGLLEKSHRIELGATYEALENLYLWGKGSWIRMDDEDSWEWEVGFRLN